MSTGVRRAGMAWKSARVVNTVEKLSVPWRAESAPVFEEGCWFVRIVEEGLKEEAYAVGGVRRWWCGL